MVIRRGYVFLGEIPVTGPGGIPTNKSGTAGVGDWIAIGGDPNSYFATIQAEYIGVLGCQAFTWNHIGTGTAAAPVPRLELYCGSILGIDWNTATDPYNGGTYPTSLVGPDYSFLLRAMGDPGRYLFNADSLSPTFVLAGGGTSGTIAPVEQLCGVIAAISGVGATLTLTLTQNHGIPAGTSDVVWIYGLNPFGSAPPDPQIEARHVATAHATNPKVLTITLPATWNGQSGVLPSGIVTRARYRITAVSNPSGNTLRVRMSDGFPSFIVWSNFATLWIGGVTTTGTALNGAYLHTQKAISFVAAQSASTAIAATAPGTLTKTSGTWTDQPQIGEVIQIAGGANNGKRIRVTASTTNTITGSAVDGSAALVTEAAGTSITLTNYAVLDVAFGSALSVAGYSAGEGYCFFRSPWHPVFWPECDGKFDIPRTIDKWASVDAAALAYFAAYPGGVFAGNTVEIAGVMLGNLGYSDSASSPTSASYEAVSLCWRYAYGQLIRAIRERLAPLTSSGQDAADVSVVVANFGVDLEPHTSNPALYKGGDYIQTTKSIQFGTSSAAADNGAAIVETSDLPHGLDSRVLSARGSWDLGIRLWNALAGLKSGAATGTERVANIVVLLGQSHMEGAINNLATQPFQEMGDPDFDSSWMSIDLTTVLRPRGIYIFGNASGAFAEYAPVVNAVSHTARFAARWPTHLTAVTGGPGIGNVGPEVSLLPELRQRFENVYAIKIAAGGASLQPVLPATIPTFDLATADIAQDIANVWDRAKAACYAKGLVPTVRLIVWDQAEGDATGDWPSTYGDAERSFIAWLRDLFRTDGRSKAPIPTVIALGQTHDRSIFDNAKVDLINAAKRAHAADTPMIAIASMQGLPKNHGNVHDTFEACVARGRRYDHAAGTLISADGFEVDGGASINPALSADTFEDWTGFTDTTSQAESAGSTSGAGAGSVSTEGASASVAATVSGSTSEIATQIIALCDAAIAAGLDVLAYSLNGRTVTRRGTADILSVRRYYAALLRNSQGYSSVHAAF